MYKVLVVVGDRLVGVYEGVVGIIEWDGLVKVVVGEVCIFGIAGEVWLC
jgi:hypothetical protein